MISVATEVLDKTTELKSSILKLGINEDCDKFDLQNFTINFCDKFSLKMDNFVIKKIQKSSVIITVEIYGKTKPSDRKRGLTLMFQSCTDTLQDELGKIRMFFMFMGPEESFSKMQTTHAEIRLHPDYNRIYGHGYGRFFWSGSLNDGKDRGNQPYYCPVGWERWSFYVTDSFDKKFKGWCICYHGTKFAYGLSILLNGMKPAEIKALGAGIYTSPSINYASHPRYAEVMPIPSSARNIFKSGEYIQYVLECRVHPNSIKTIGCETLLSRNTRIDPNIRNEAIEWVIDHKNRNILDFNDPESPIVCTGVMIRITDDHPGLLPESQWWYQSHLCDNTKCCWLGINRSVLIRKKQSGNTCNIIYSHH